MWKRATGSSLFLLFIVLQLFIYKACSFGIKATTRKEGFLLSLLFVTKSLRLSDLIKICENKNLWLKNKNLWLNKNCYIIYKTVPLH